MKQLTVCAILVSSTFAMSAYANSTAIQLRALNPSVCEISSNQLLLDLQNPSTQQTATANLTMKCNDFNGAKVTMVSSQGGLEADDGIPDDYSLSYKATFTPTGLPALEFTTPGGNGTNNLESNAMSYPGSLDLASGIAAVLEVTNIDTAPWAGGYSDTITMNITAN